MPPAPTVKILAFEDISALNSCIETGGHSTEDNYFTRSLSEQESGKRVVFAAWSGAGRVQGYVHLNFNPLYRPFARLGLPEIQDLFVHPDFRRQGLGGHLVEACERHARGIGTSEIGIGVGITPEFGSAQRLYARLGYIPDGAGVVFEREGIRSGEVRPLDDRLCLMLTKTLV
ncbi:MAG: GNAT family N-acetyltransferase [Pseudobdellovibrionaceae bacterium]